MRQEIIENLRSALQKPVEKERVVYIMVELRRLVDKMREENGSNLPEWEKVKHWCTWAVHTNLTNKEFAIATLEEMEKFIIGHPEDKFHHSDFNHQFFSLEDLRESLYNMLEQFGLPSDITNIPPWFMFAKNLVEHLKDCPLKKSTGLIREFRFIKKNHIPVLLS
ncbi:hypothetical protein KW807_01635, partial [Candidatus Parcubacteria bacterium]|nr:hypothetical protein [Candidatus Parcubacteria bacterium]